MTDTAQTRLSTRHGKPRVVELPRLELVVLDGPQRGKRHLMSRDHLRIGTSQKNDVVLTDETVSRAHCMITRETSGFVLRDCKSTNGTLLEGAEVREAVLQPGMVLTVGKTELKVRVYSERLEVLPSEENAFGQAVGGSLAMREIFGLLERLAPSNANILLGGETGTGKDVLARSIHQQSPRARAPFVIVDCGAVVPSLVESELFGHEKGAFSGATEMRRGAFELADGGTLFLDEVGELPLDLQPKLLRVLEERSFRRVGGSREVQVDIRVVAASKRNLKAEVERGKFRRDLYFRLAVAPIIVPPLRERRGDVQLLCETLLERIAQREGADPMALAPDALAALEGHDWPGNVRELHNALKRACILAEGAGNKRIGFRDLPPPTTLPFAPAEQAANLATPHTFDESKSYRETKAEVEAVFEKQYVAWLLGRHGGNVSAAARAADMDRKYLHKLAKKHGLKKS